MYISPKNIILICFLALIFLTGLLFKPFFNSLFLGLVIVIIFYPLYLKLLARLKKGPTIVAGIMTLLVLVVIVIPVGFLGVILTNQAIKLIEYAQRLDWAVQTQVFLKSGNGIARLVMWASERFHIGIDQMVSKFSLMAVQRSSQFFYEHFNAIVSNSVALVIQFIIMILTIYYMFRDGKRLISFLSDLMPFSKEHKVMLSQKFKDVGRAVMYGNSVSGLVQGVVGGVGFALFGLPSPLFWGVVMAFSGMIPLLGPVIVYIPATIYLFATGSTKMAIGFGLYNVLLVSTVDNLVKPLVMGGRIKVHSFLILLSLLGGLALFGTMGILYGPFIIVFLLVFSEMYKHAHSENKSRLK